jgi:hypothetical protein
VNVPQGAATCADCCGLRSTLGPDEAPNEGLGAKSTSQIEWVPSDQPGPFLSNPTPSISKNKAFAAAATTSFKLPCAR